MFVFRLFLGVRLRVFNTFQDRSQHGRSCVFGRVVFCSSIIVRFYVRVTQRSRESRMSTADENAGRFRRTTSSPGDDITIKRSNKHGDNVTEKQKRSWSYAAKPNRSISIPDASAKITLRLPKFVWNNVFQKETTAMKMCRVHDTRENTDWRRYRGAFQVFSNGCPILREFIVRGRSFKIVLNPSINTSLWHKRICTEEPKAVKRHQFI